MKSNDKNVRIFSYRDVGIRAKSYLNRICIEITKLFLEHVLSSPALKGEEFISLYIERIQ